MAKFRNFLGRGRGKNEVISMNAQVAQSLSMAITSHCVVEHCQCSKRRTRETKDGPGRAPLLELDLHLQTANRLQTTSWKPPAFMSEVPPMLPF